VVVAGNVRSTPAEKTEQSEQPDARERAQPLLAAGLSRELAGAIGNRAMGRVLARDPLKPDDVRPDAPGGQYERSWKMKFGDRFSLAFKITASFQEHTKLAEKKTAGGGASISFWENKQVRDTAAGKTARKIQSSLIKGELAGEVFPGLKFKANAKLLETQIDLAKSDAEFALLTIAFALEGNVTEWFLDAMGVPKDKRSKTKITLSGEAKLTPQLSDIARLRDMWKARKEMEQSAKVISDTADRAKAVEREVSTAEKEIKAARKEVRALEKEAEAFKGFGKRQQKRFGSQKAYDEARQKVEDKIARAEAKATASAERKAALKIEQKALRRTLEAEVKVLERSRGIMAKAASGLKSKASKAIAKLVATRAGKVVAKFLAHAIPIINAIAFLSDAYDIAKGLWALLHGAKLGFGGGDEGDPSGAHEGEGPSGEGKDAGHGSGAPDAGAPDAAAPDAGTPDTGAGKAPDAGQGSGSDPGDAGTGPAGGVQIPEPPGPAPADAGPGGGNVPGGTSPGDPASPATDLADPLHPRAKDVAEALAHGGTALDKDQIWQLDSVIPKDLTDAELAELKRRLAAKGGTGQTDPYELIATIQDEVEKIRRGHDEESALVWADGTFVPEQSSGAAPDVLKHEAAAEEAKSQPPAAPATTSTPTAPGADSKPAEGAQPAAADAATKGKKTKTKPKKSKTKSKGGAKAKGKGPKAPKGPPTSLLPEFDPSDSVQFDSATKKADWRPGGYDKLVAHDFTLSDGLQVAITEGRIDQQAAGSMFIVTLSVDVMVSALPPHAGAGYPWQQWDVRTYDVRLWVNPDTSSWGRLETQEGAGNELVEAAVELRGDALALKQEGKTIEFGSAKLRVDGLAGQFKKEQGDQILYGGTMTVTVMSMKKGSIEGVVDPTGASVVFEEGKQVSFVVVLARPKAGGKAP
jgi:hypothetical protein